MVRAEALTADAITRAMRAGNFYASSGVILEGVTTDSQGMTVKIVAQTGVTYATRFVGTRLRDGKAGKAGEILKEVTGTDAAYSFKGDELYLRATIVSSRRHPNGYDPADFETAWIQPVVVTRPKKE